MLMVGICPFVLSTRAGGFQEDEEGVCGCDVSFMSTHRVDRSPSHLRHRVGSGDCFGSEECADACGLLRERISLFVIDFFSFFYVMLSFE